MWIYLFLLALVGCVGSDQDFKDLYRTSCGEELTHAPVTCGGEPFLPKLLQSKEELVTMNFDVLASFIGHYTPEQLRVTNETGEGLWVLALKAGAEKIYMNLLQVPGLGIDRKQATEIFYGHSPKMFLNYRNYQSLLIDPSMELYLRGNGQNPHSLYPLTNASKDTLLRHLHEEQSLAQIANLFYATNVLRDADFVRDLGPYMHLVLPFPPDPALTVSLGALVAKKWVFQLKEEFFIENEAFLDPLALAVYEGAEVDAYLPFTKKSHALAVAYALLDDSQLKKIQHFSFQKISLLKPHPAFKAIRENKSSEVKEQFYRGMRLEKGSYKSLRAMILALKAGDHDSELVDFFWRELKGFIKNYGLYPSYNRFIGHELKPVEDVLATYGYDLEKLIPKFHKHLKQRDYFGEGPL